MQDTEGFAIPDWTKALYPYPLEYIVSTEYISFNAKSSELIRLLIGKSSPTLTSPSNISPLVTNLIKLFYILLPLSSTILLFFLTSQCCRRRKLYHSRANCGCPPRRSNPLPSVSEVEVIVMSYQTYCWNGSWGSVNLSNLVY